MPSFIHEELLRSIGKMQFCAKLFNFGSLIQNMHVFNYTSVCLFIFAQCVQIFSWTPTQPMVAETIWLQLHEQIMY